MAKLPSRTTAWPEHVAAPTKHEILTLAAFELALDFPGETPLTDYQRGRLLVAYRASARSRRRDGQAKHMQRKRRQEEQ